MPGYDCRWWFGTKPILGNVIVNELAEDGVSVLNTHFFEEVWPCKITGLDLDRMASENTIESIEFSVGTVDKY